MLLSKAGDILKRQRLELGYTLDHTASEVGVSINYISELERNNKTNPSDEVIVKLAKVYRVDEDDLFNLFGKMPLATKEEVLSNPTLMRILSRIKKENKLTPQQKYDLYEKLHELYEEMANEEE